MNDYCKNHIDGKPCKLTNRPKANQIFCDMICQGNYRDFLVEDVEVLRARMRRPLTEDMLHNEDMVTVIIPCHKEKTWMIQRTVDSLIENSRGPIDIYVVYDGDSGEEIKGATTWYCSNRVGQRVIGNLVVGQTEGKYVFRLDGHCLMSPQWDVRMKASCRDGVLVTTCFDSLDDDFKPQGRDNAFVQLRSNLTNVHGRGWKKIECREAEEETMSITGTSFMMTRNDYNRLGGCNEKYGNWGNLGAEWALKFWLSGGRVIIRTDVVCYHYYRKTTPFEVNITQKDWAIQDLYKQFVLGENDVVTRPFEWLLYHFSHYVKWNKNANVRV